MPTSTLVDIPQAEPRQMLAVLRRAVRLSASAPYFALVCHGPQADDGRRGPLLLAPQCVPHGPGLSGRDPQPEARRAGAACSPPAHHRAGPHAAPVVAGPAQGTPAGLWLVPHPLEWRHAGPDAVGQARTQNVGRDDAPLAPRD